MLTWWIQASWNRIHHDIQKSFCYYSMHWILIQTRLDYWLVFIWSLVWLDPDPGSLTVPSILQSIIDWVVCLSPVRASIFQTRSCWFLSISVTRWGKFRHRGKIIFLRRIFLEEFIYYWATFVAKFYLLWANFSRIWAKNQTIWSHCCRFGRSWRILRQTCFLLSQLIPIFFDERHQEKEMMVWLKLVFNK